MRTLRFLRTLVALLAVMLPTGAPVLPQMHAHFTQDAEGRLHVVVHEHWALHRLDAPHGATLDDEESAVYFDQSSIATAAFNYGAPAVATAIDIDGDAGLRHLPRPVDSDIRPHGPPRLTASLRAPPRTT